MSYQSRGVGWKAQTEIKVPSAMICELSAMNCELSAMNCELPKPGGMGVGGAEGTDTEIKIPSAMNCELSKPGFVVEAWSMSGRSFAHFAHCQEFLLPFRFIQIILFLRILSNTKRCLARRVKLTLSRDLMNRVSP